MIYARCYTHCISTTWRRIYSWLITNRLCRSGDRLIIGQQGLPSCRKFVHTQVAYFSFFFLFSSIFLRRSIATMPSSLFLPSADVFQFSSRPSICSSRRFPCGNWNLNISIYTRRAVIECIHSTSPAGRSRRKSNIFFHCFFLLINQKGKILFYFSKRGTCTSKAR